MICSKCGTKSADQAKFCTNCGEVFAKPNNQPGAPDPVKKKRKNLLIMAVAAGVLVLAALIVIFIHEYDHSLFISHMNKTTIAEETRMFQHNTMLSYFESVPCSCHCRCLVRYFFKGLREAVIMDSITEIPNTGPNDKDCKQN